MKIYFVRHGQTDWNVEMRAQGRKDLPLNTVGRKQAEELRDKIKEIKFDVVYASPLKRARETAEIATDRACEIIFDDRLMERSFGDFEGKIVKSWLDLVEGVDINDITLDEILGNVEPVKSMLARAGEFIDFLKRNYGDDTKILVVSHGGIFKAFDWILSEHAADDTFGATHLGNAEIREYTI